MSRKFLFILLSLVLLTSSLLASCSEVITDPISEESGASEVSSSDPSEIISNMISVETSAGASDGSSAESFEELSSVFPESSSAASSKSSSAVSSEISSSENSSSASSKAVNKKYYLAGSWNGYTKDDEMFLMELVPGTQDWYTITVELTPSNRDEMYDGHWYKVTEGNWDHSYGIDNYIQQPAPVKKLDNGTAIGLGSVWIDEDLTLTVMFDSTDLMIYDNANGKVLPTP